MRTSTVAGRLLLYSATAYRDLARHDRASSGRRKAQAYVDLLTPVAKAWASEMGFAAASTGMQLLGGVGFVEDSGMPQRLRDSRIAMIYEGTNGIQAIDLVMRKLPREGGRWIREMLTDIRTTVVKSSVVNSSLSESVAAVSAAATYAEHATEVLLARISTAPNDALAGASAYLELLGLALTGQLMIERAIRAAESRMEVAERAALESEFFATEYVARAQGLDRAILVGASRLAALPT